MIWAVYSQCKEAHIWIKFIRDKWLYYQKLKQQKSTIERSPLREISHQYGWINTDGYWLVKLTGYREDKVSSNTFIGTIIQAYKTRDIFQVFRR